MNIKFIFKALSFSLVISFVFASEINNCNEIKEYLEKKSLNYTKTIEKCTMNDQGKITELKINNEDLQEEDVNKILSYNSIKNLEYVVVFNEDETQNDTPYSHPLIPHPGYSKFPYAVVNLPKLETLNFNYKNFRYIKYFPSAVLTLIEDGTFKSLKNLKRLTLSQVTLTNENLKEISTLTNLEEIKFNLCSFDNDGFTSFENNKKLSKLSIININGLEKAIPNNINKIKSLKEIYIGTSYCEGESYDFNGLENLETLYIDLAKECNFDLSKNEKLTELSIVSYEDLIFDIRIRSALSLEFPNSLEKLTLYGLTFSPESYQAIASLSNLEELNMENSRGNLEDNFKSLESRDKLRKLTMAASEVTEKNSDFLKELVNLTYLDLSRNDLSEIPQLENLKNLEYLDLSNNLLSKFPEALSTIKNIEYIDLESNNIYDKLPESLNQLENLKYFNIKENKNVSGKVLTNKSLEKCVYSEDDDLCIPKDYTLNCLAVNTEEKTLSYKVCEEEINIEESTDGKCGEGHGKCPSGQCCNKDGECGTTENYCLVSKNCQINYGNCIDECEEIYNQLRKLNNYSVDNVKCTANKQGKAQALEISYADQTYLDQLENISDLESLILKYSRDINNFKPLLHNKNLTTFKYDSFEHIGEFPEEISSLNNLKTLEIRTSGIKTIPKNIKNLKNLEYLDLFRGALKDLPDEFGELENLKILKLSDNGFTKFPEVIGKLKNLEELDLNFNDIDDEIPESYNNLSELKTILLGGNKNLTGKVLQNKKLVTCEYNYSWESYDDLYPLCRSGNEKCLTENLIKGYPLCSDSSTPELTTENPITEEPETEEPVIEKPTEKPIITTEKPLTTIEKSLTITEKPVITTEKPVITTEKPVTATEKPVTTTEKPVTTTEKPVTTTEKPVTTTEKPATTTEKPEIEEPVNDESSNEEPAIEEPLNEDSSNEESSTTKKHETTTNKSVTTTNKPVTTTEKPTTTNEKPAIEEPVNDESSNEEPVIKEPINEDSSNEEPVIEKPINEDSSNEEPVIEKPINEDSSNEEPVIEKPINEDSSNEEPVIEKPINEDSSNEEPVIEKPINEDSSNEEPVIEKPIHEDSSNEEPVIEEPINEDSSNENEKPQTIITIIATVTVTTNESSTVTFVPSIEGKCGEGYGRCPPGQCCSKYGWCGKSDVYCAEGCKSDYGECNSETATSEPTVKEKCGKNIGSCSPGYCCSKDGLCGKSYGHCAISEGCQSKYGLCTEDNTSIEGRCGKIYGKCRTGYCCSSQGWCGSSDLHCSVSNGCQSEFGICK